MGKIRGKQKRLVARFFHREAKAPVVAIEADKNPAGFNVSSKIIAGGDIGLRTRQELAIDIHLQVMRIGTVQPVHEERHPSRPSLKKADTELGEAIEYSVGQHTRRLGHNAKWMTQGVHG